MINRAFPLGVDTSFVRQFSLARHALEAALHACNIGAGNTVLLPSLICRDLLASLSRVGAEPCWYPVGTNLCPENDETEWPVAKVVIAVNFFGFPQDLTPFRRYAARTGAILIEDNAHGFLSRDIEGQWLGLRCDHGVFSFRKTLPVPDGAAWVALVPITLPLQLTETGEGFAPSIRRKTALRHVRIIGGVLAGLATQIARAVRQLSTGQSTPSPAHDAEYVIPGHAAPHSGLTATLMTLDVEAEIERRRALYYRVDAVAKKYRITSVFDELPSMTAPYGYPFRADTPAASKPLVRWAERRGFDVFPWPDLPDVLAANVPAHYRNLYLVNFLR